MTKRSRAERSARTTDTIVTVDCSVCGHPRVVHPSANRAPKPHWPKCSYPTCECTGWVETTRETEIAYLIEHARSIIAPERAERIARAIADKRLEDVGIKGRPMKSFYRATYSDPDLDGVGVYELAIAIATALGEPAPDGGWHASPFHGQGRSAELWTRRAVAAIQRHYGLAPISELN